MDAALREYKTLAGIPYISSIDVFTNDDEISMRAIYTQRDHVQKCRRKTQVMYGLAQAQGSGLMHKVDIPGGASDITDIGRSYTSKDGSMKVVLRNIGKEKEKKRLIEFWKGFVLDTVLDVTDKHGDFYEDTTFGTLEISKDSHWVIYIAEDKENPIDKFSFVPNWGERFAKAFKPSLFILQTPWSGSTDFKCHDPRRIDLPDDISPADAHFVSSSENKIRAFFTGYVSEPRKYGIVYCMNRPAYIYIADIKVPDSKEQEFSSITGNELQVVSDKSRSSRSPRLSPNAKTLVWLDTQLGGPHASCSRLLAADIRIDGSVEPTRTLCDMVAKVYSTREFPGLYLEALIQDPFLQVGEGEWKLALTSIWGSKRRVIVFDLDKASTPNPILELESPGFCYSSVLHVCFGTRMIISRSSPISIPELFVVEHAGSEYKTSNLGSIHTDSMTQAILDPLAASILKNPENELMEVIYIRKNRKVKDTTVYPIILYPHGGPHSTTTTDFPHLFPHHLILANHDYDILLINYTGSLGFGQEFVENLIGKIGDLEIAETVEALNLLDERNRPVLLMGGSHGGYIGASIAAKYPDLLKAAVLRNPVINVAQMYNQSDIPDWCIAEAGFKQLSFADPPLADIKLMEHLGNISTPIVYGEQVKTPILFLLGENDLRVPPSQSLGYYYYLRSRHVPTRACMYPGTGHALDTVEAELEVFQETYAWFERYTMK